MGVTKGEKRATNYKYAFFGALAIFAIIGAFYIGDSFFWGASSGVPPATPTTTYIVNVNDALDPTKSRSL
jgi:hypothetical protein